MTTTGLGGPAQGWHGPSTEPRLPEALTVTSMLRVLEDSLLSAVLLGDRADAPVTRIVVADPVDSPDLVRGCIVLAVGMEPATTELTELVLRAERAGAVAVVARRRHPMAVPAQVTGVSVLGLRQGVDWSDLHSLIVAAGSMRAADIEIVASNDGLFALANALAERIGGAVTIEDLGMRVLAYSTVPGQDIDAMRRAGILDRQVPDDATNESEYRRIMRAPGATWGYEPRDMLPRLAVAVRSGGEPLGSIWVIEGSTPLADDAAAILEHAATVAAVQLARLRLDRDETRRTHQRHVARLMRGGVDAITSGRTLGLPADEPATAVALGRVDGRADDMTLSRAAERFTLALMSHQLRGAAAAVQGLVVTVVVGRDLEASLLRVATQLIPTLDRGLGGSWHAAVGEQAGTLAEVARSVTQARSAVTSLRPAPDSPRAVRYRDCESSLFFHRLAQFVEQHPELPRGQLDRVAAHDATHGTDYVRSLRSWCGHGYDVAAAAADLGTHPNTLRYRLRRLGELFAVPVDDADWRLWVSLLLRVGG